MKKTKIIRKMVKGRSEKRKWERKRWKEEKRELKERNDLRK